MTPSGPRIVAAQPADILKEVCITEEYLYIWTVLTEYDEATAVLDEEWQLWSG